MELPARYIDTIALSFKTFLSVKPISHRTRWAHGIHTRLYTDWLVRLFIWISWHELDSNVARACTNKGRSKVWTRFAYEFIRLLYGSKYGLVRSCTIKHDIYSIYSTFTGFT
jgi:hypothetical protein